MSSALQPVAGATQTGLIGPVILSTTFSTAPVAGDRGCLPGFGTASATGLVQSPAQQALLPLGPLSVGSGVMADYQGIISVLCHTHGVCCTTFNCNSSVINSINLMLLFLSIISSKIIF